MNKHTCCLCSISPPRAKTHSKIQLAGHMTHLASQSECRAQISVPEEALIRVEVFREGGWLEGLLSVPDSIQTFLDFRTRLQMDDGWTESVVLGFGLCSGMFLGPAWGGGGGFREFITFPLKLPSRRSERMGAGALTICVSMEKQQAGVPFMAERQTFKDWDRLLRAREAIRTKV